MLEGELIQSLGAQPAPRGSVDIELFRPQRGQALPVAERWPGQLGHLARRQGVGDVWVGSELLGPLGKNKMGRRSSHPRCRTGVK